MSRNWTNCTATDTASTPTATRAGQDVGTHEERGERGDGKDESEDRQRREADGVVAIDRESRRNRHE